MEENQVFKKYFWLYGAIALVVVLALVISLAVVVGERNRVQTMLEGVYEKSFYDLISDVDDIEIKLDKLSVSRSTSYQRELLSELSSRADLASVSLSELSTLDTTLQDASRYINQLSDFSKSLVKKLAKGESLSDSDKKSLKDLQAVCKEIGIRLGEIMDKLASGDKFIGKDNGEILNSLTEMNDISIDYPELIYDGPFSDAVVNKAPLGISGEEISVEQGLSIAQKASSVDELVSLGVWEGKIKTLNYATKDNSTLVKLAPNGMLLTYSTTKDSGEQNLNEDECVDIALEYAIKNGFSGLTPVWVSNYDGDMFINLVYEIGDIIYYNDMVKVKVDSTSGKVLAFDAMSYAYNHTERQTQNPEISEEESLQKAPSEMSVQSVRLAVVPKEQSEVLTYEIFGSIGEKKYFIYVDAMTGDEINILCVIDSEQGRLLM